MFKARQALVFAVCALIASFAFPPEALGAGEEPGTKKPKAPVSKELGEAEAIQKRHEWFYGIRRPGAYGRMAELRAQAVEFTRAEESRLRAEGADLGAGVWTARGPASSTFGGWSFGNVAGRVPALAKDFTNGILYAGSASGGLWKSTNDGASWTCIFDSAGTMTVGEVAVDPQTPSTIWVGTGENTAWCEDYFGIGLLKSTDGGGTWQAKNGSGANNLGNLSAFASIVIHPSNSNRLVVGGGYRDCVNGNYYSGGIYTTDDGGDTWTVRLASKQVSEIVMDPTDPSLLWAGCGNSGLYRSADGGNTWTLVAGLPSGSVGRVEVALAPSDPSYVYVLFQSASGSPQFYQSTNGGATWTLKASGSSACDGQCSYNMVLRVNESNPTTVYRGTIKIYRSTDGGASWTDLIGSWGGTQKVHQDIHEFLMDPSDPNTFYVGCDGGVWKTSDGGSHFTNLNSNLNLTQFYDIGNHPTDDDIILGGAQDNSSLARTSGDVWGLQQVTGDGFVCAINPATPATCYIAGYPYNHGSGTVPSVYRSTAGVWGPFNFITNTTNGFAANDRIGWVTPYTMDPSNPSVLFLGTHRTYRSITGGTSWTQVGPADMAGSSGTVTVVQVSRAGSSWVYAGTSTSRVWRSVDGGMNWGEISAGLPAGRDILDIDTSPDDGTRAFCVVSGFNTAHFYEYSGASWVAKGTGLPNVPANSVYALSATEIFVGTDTGVFRSTDGGASFSPFNSGLPAGLVVTDLEYAPLTGTLTAGTYGRGAWQITLGPPTCVVNCTASAPGTGREGVPVAFAGGASPANCTGSPSYSWSFGDGGASTQQNPSHTYASSGSYTWQVTVTVDGKTCGRSGTIVVSPPCSVACTATVPGTAVAEVPVAFKSTATPSNCTGAASFLWDFGDGASATQQNPSHAYAQVGTFTWTVTATVEGKPCSKTGSITVTPPCSVTCSATVPPTGQAGVDVAFAGSASPANCSGTAAYSWVFGDGAASVQKNPVHSYAEAGSFPWSLTVTLQGVTCMQGGTITISEPCSVTCSASAQPASGTAPLSVSFTGSATASHCAGAASYAWSFGDGGTSSQQSPNHAYASAGSYGWTLTAAADGATCTQSGTVEVSAPACALACEASAAPVSGVAPLTVSFTGSASHSHCAGEPSFAWSFGDGGTSSEQSPAHPYTSAGSFTWTLMVSVDGATCAKSGTLEVSAPCALGCEASAAPVSGTAPLAVSFSGSASPSHCSGTPSFLWSFGDGGSSAEQNPGHTYASEGSFGWALTVSVDGITCAKSGTVAVSAPPCELGCAASATPASGTAPLTVSFTGSASPIHCAGAPSFLWSFGDGGSSAEQNPSHPYASAGSYAWSLTVSVDGASCARGGSLTVSPGIPGDADGDGAISIGEVQQAVNMFLGIQAPGNGVDCNGDGVVSVGEVQKVVNGFLGLPAAC